LPEVLAEFAGQPFSGFKTRLAEVAVESLGPIGTELQRLVADPGYVDSVLADGARRARDIAGPVLAQVHDIVGLLRA
jgi:tryptophanyl-tRNA synthetase